MRIITQISRFLVGTLFIFSGFIKANDPLGFSYKLNEYWEVFGMHWLSGASLFLAIFICIFEIIVGFSLLLGSRVKLTLWLLLLMIVFFTFLTFYSAYFNKVNSCGCFGDAIPLTPWQSFTKDIVLLIFIIILFIGRSNITPLFGQKMENAVLLVVILAATAFPLYTYNYLPVIDFRPYKIGTNIYEALHPQFKYYYLLKNKKTGEQKEFDKWPENWESEWEYVSNRTEQVNKDINPIVGFNIQNDKGEEVTDQFLTDPNYSFILVAYDLDKTNMNVQGRINDFVALCQKDSINFIGLTTSPNEKISDFRHEVQAMYDYYRCPDDVPLKTMIRSNPGLMLLKGGVVIDMWHYHSFPSYSDVKKKYF
jgi:uncharacterized membrane protein YphA (DoxX/SURF4 family)